MEGRGLSCILSVIEVCVGVWGNTAAVCVLVCGTGKYNVCVCCVCVGSIACLCVWCPWVCYGV